MKFLSMLLLLTASGAALADWTKVTTGYQWTSYADLGTLHKSGDIAAMDVLIDYVKVPFDGNNLAYLSLKMHAEYNCATQQFRAVNLSSYSGHMATGNRPYTSFEADEWQPVLAKHSQAGLWSAACGKRLTSPAAPAVKKKSRP